jgi:uncharacterized protein YbjT (DUF2867 family)/membrane protease YdiL (CAAX protease family)
VTRVKIAVFGGTGFLGVHVCRALAAGGHGVVAISRRPASGEIEHRACDAGRSVDPAMLADCDVVVNLIGIKRARAGSSFAAAHVEAVRNIVNAMRAAGLERLVHVSVSASPAGPDPYLDTKQRGEQLVCESDLRWTIVRPGVVYGEGDDLIHHLVTTLRHSPLFPAPDGGRAELAVVDVEDVAAVVAACVFDPRSIEASYDVVGPERIRVRDLVARIAKATSLPTRIVPVPAALLWPAAALMESALADPPITRAQLNLLGLGVVGDPGPAREQLGIEPRALDDARIRALADQPRNRAPAFGLSLRGGWPIRVLVGVALLGAASLLSPTGTGADHWLRVGGSYVIAFALLGAWFRLPWATLLAPRASAVGLGLLAGAGWYLACALGAAALFAITPALRDQAAAVYAWANALPMRAAVPALVAIVAAEDVYWRAGVGLTIAERSRPAFAVVIAALGFAAAHLTLGPPLLWVTAAICGAFWTWLLIRTRSLLTTFIAHLSWDIAVLWLRPLA